MPIPEGQYTVPPIGEYEAWRASGPHKGVDQYGPEGTESLLEADAQILRVSFNPDSTSGFGHSVAYRHVHDDATVIEAHFKSKPKVVAGETYPAGTVVGLRGDTGNAVRVGPHVHVEVRNSRGQLIDPTPYFANLRLQFADAPSNPEEDDMQGGLWLKSTRTGDWYEILELSHRRIKEHAEAKLVSAAYGRNAREVAPNVITAAIRRTEENRAALKASLPGGSSVNAAEVARLTREALGPDFDEVLDAIEDVPDLTVDELKTRL